MSEEEELIDGFKYAARIEVDRLLRRDGPVAMGKRLDEVLLALALDAEKRFDDACRKESTGPHYIRVRDFLVEAMIRLGVNTLPVQEIAPRGAVHHVQAHAKPDLIGLNWTFVWDGKKVATLRWPGPDADGYGVTWHKLEE